jgi:hypothetical protein
LILTQLEADFDVISETSRSQLIDDYFQLAAQSMPMMTSRFTTSS